MRLPSPLKPVTFAAEWIENAMWHVTFEQH
jgi:hypothetical protein